MASIEIILAKLIKQEAFLTSFWKSKKKKKIPWLNYNTKFGKNPKLKE